MPHFLAGLKDASPGTEYKLIVDDNYEHGTCTFKFVFWAFRPCIIGFKKCRPVISIDATHLYGKYKGKLMIAVATDLSNSLHHCREREHKDLGLVLGLYKNVCYRPETPVCHI